MRQSLDGWATFIELSQKFRGIGVNVGALGSEVGSRMQLYFDESGDFNPSRSGRPKFSFVVGIIIPEMAAENLKSDFTWLVWQLSASEFVKGEPKDSRVTL